MLTSIHLPFKITTRSQPRSQGGESPQRCIKIQIPTHIRLQVPATPLVRAHLEGIVPWAQTRQTNGFLEALNGLFQAAKRRARGFTRLSTIRTVIHPIVGKLDFRAINPHGRSTHLNFNRASSNYARRLGAMW
jgi:hypothetical protein